MERPELHPDLTWKDIAAAMDALNGTSPTQFTVDTMRENGGRLPSISKQEIDDLFNPNN